jgi:hypothetical protein
MSLFGRTGEELRRDHSLALVLDRIDHATLLANELDSARCRRDIATRGDTLCRYFAIRRALDATAEGATLH